MFSDDVASATIEIAKEVTPEVLRAICKILENILAMQRTTGGLLWERYGKEHWENYLVEQKLKREAGQQEVIKFLKKYQEVQSIDVSEMFETDPRKEMFDKAMKKYNIPYAIQYDEILSTETKIYIPEKLQFLYNEAVKQIKYEISQNEVMHKVFADELKRNPVDLSKANIMPENIKQKFEESINGRHFELNQSNPNWDNEICFDRAIQAMELPSKGQALDIQDGTKKDAFVKRIEALEDKTVVDKKFILCMDESEKFHHINLLNKQYVEFGVEDIQKVLKAYYPNVEMTGEQLLNEMKMYMGNMNETVKDTQYLLETKYKDYAPIQKEFLKECLFEEKINPLINVQQLDNHEFSISKMVALKEAQELGVAKLDVAKDVLNHEQIFALANLKRIELENNIALPQAIEMIVEKDITNGELMAIMETVKDNPYSSRDDLEAAQNTAKEEQRKINNLMEKGVIKISSEKEIEHLAHEKYIWESLENSKPVVELGQFPEQRLSMLYNIEKIDHRDMRGDWKLYTQKNGTAYFLNENKEIKISTEMKGKKVEKIMSINKAQRISTHCLEKSMNNLSKGR